MGWVRSELPQTRLKATPLASVMIGLSATQQQTLGIEHFLSPRTLPKNLKASCGSCAVKNVENDKKIYIAFLIAFGTRVVWQRHRTCQNKGILTDITGENDCAEMVSVQITQGTSCSILQHAFKTGVACFLLFFPGPKKAGPRWSEVRGPRSEVRGRR